MPCPGAHATCTRPVAGCVNEKVYTLAAPDRLLAGALLIRRSAGSTPVTFSLKTTVMLRSARTVELAEGDSVATVGGVRSWRLYCHVAPGPAALKGLGGSAWSVIP